MNDTGTDMHDRRSVLETVRVTDRRHYSIVSISGEATEAGLQIRLRYVPDQDFLTPDSFGRYCDNVSWPPGAPLESVAQTILEDINDQVIPCWLEIRLSRNGKVDHEVRIEDRQPRWDDKGLLDRLGP